MRISFREALSRKEWLHKELMQSLNGETIAKAIEDQYFDVKLLVNGVEIEPSFYNNLIDKIDEHIENAAKAKIIQNLEKAIAAAYELNELVEKAKANIINQFKLD